MYETVIGSGKTTMAAIQMCYDMYVKITASDLSCMKRIPRKMKKKYKKCPNIWNEYERLKCQK